MSEWKKVKLKDCCHSISDGDHLPPPKSNSGVPFVTIANIDATNHIDFGNTMFVPLEYYNSLNDIRKAKCNDILYSVVGSFGKPVLIKENIPFAFQRHIAILRPNNEIADSRFLYYVMLTRDFFMQADTVAIGAAQRTISLTALRNMEVKLPSMETQYRIASILSRYDSLIENYQKQIKLLEEAAQRLYKEWFVDLHFPGHENAKIVDGVPEGWEKKKISDIVVIYDKKRKPLSSMQRQSMEKIYPYYGAASLMDYVDNYLFDGTYLLMGEDGTVISNEKYPMLQYVWGKFWVSNHAHVLQGKEPYSTEFIYMMLKQMTILDVVTGAAQPKISQGRLAAKEIIMPANELVKEYDKIVVPMIQQAKSLQSQIRLLTEARDRLLPKLMSGEIEI